MRTSKRTCNHDWHIYERSNALQVDDNGYVYRLFIRQCSKCGEYDNRWMNVPKEELDEIKNGKSFLLKWKPENLRKLPIKIKKALAEYRQLCKYGCLTIPCRECKYLGKFDGVTYNCKRVELMDILWDDYRDEVEKIDEEEIWK